MKQFLFNRLVSFRNALRGIVHVFRTQKNAWIHALITILVVLLASWLELPARDWAVLLLTIAMVLISEFINTALESLVDLASPSIHPLAKAAKDVGAAAVLISALAAILVGLLLLGPPLLNKL